MKETVFKIRSERGDQLQPIPLSVILPHADHAYRIHEQTLFQLDQRGGLTPKEVLHVLKRERWYDSDESHRIIHMTFDEAHREMVLLVRQRYGQLLEEKERHEIHKACTHPERPADIRYGIRKCGRCGGNVAMEPGVV